MAENQVYLMENDVPIRVSVQKTSDMDILLSFTQ